MKVYYKLLILLGLSIVFSTGCVPSKESKKVNASVIYVEKQDSRYIIAADGYTVASWYRGGIVW